MSEASGRNEGAWDPGPLTPELAQRYARQILLPPIGGKGQQKLRTATLLLVGDAPLAVRYLTGAGLGRLWYRGPQPEVVAHDPAFVCEPEPANARPDLVLDFTGDAVSEAPILRAGAAGTRVFVDEPPTSDEPPRPEALSVAETLAAGEALCRLMGHEPKRYAFDLSP